jgi:hypothetical protein
MAARVQRKRDRGDLSRRGRRPMPAVTTHSDPNRLPLDVTVDHFFLYASPSSGDTVLLSRRVAVGCFVRYSEGNASCSSSLSIQRMAKMSAPCPDGFSHFRSRDEDRSLTHVSSQRSCGLRKDTKQSARVGHVGGERCFVLYLFLGRKSAATRRGSKSDLHRDSESFWPFAGCLANSSSLHYPHCTAQSNPQPPARTHRSGP